MQAESSAAASAMKIALFMAFMVKVGQEVTPKFKAIQLAGRFLGSAVTVSAMSSPVEEKRFQLL